MSQDEPNANDTNNTKRQKKESKDFKEGISSRFRDITNNTKINLEKKPVPETLIKNDGIKYYFYFIYVFVLLNLLTAINTNLFDFSYWLNLSNILYNNQPLLPKNLFTLFKLDLFSFFIAVLRIIIRVFVATGLAILAFDDEQNAWLRIITVPGIVFIIFGMQLIGP